MRPIGDGGQSEEVQHFGFNLRRFDEEPFAHHDGDVVARERIEERLQLVAVAPPRQVRVVLVAEADVAGFPADAIFLTIEPCALAVERLLEPERFVPA